MLIINIINFGINLFFYKMQKKKKSIYFLCNFAFTKMNSRYFFLMIKNILIIQKYLNIYINKEKVFDKINKNYDYLLRNETFKLNEEIKNSIIQSHKNTVDNNYSLYN